MIHKLYTLLQDSSSSSSMANDEILHDFSPMLREYIDGRIERLTGTEYVPASVDPVTGVQSKDVEISPELNISARLYLPKNATPAKKLPLLLYYHGGGFVTESAFSRHYHNHLKLLVAEAKVVAVSVNYRLAPEHPLPIAYQDSWLSLKWVASQFTESGQEEWIKEYADLNRVYLGGDSAGGNIAHNIAIPAGRELVLEGVTLRGVFLNCPFFTGKAPIESEEINAIHPRALLEKFWTYVCPSSTTGLDDPMINPAMDPNLSSFECKRLLVYVAEKDRLRGRNLLYKETLIESGWGGEIEVVEAKGEDHAFSVFNPTSESAVAMLKKVASFLNQ